VNRSEPPIAPSPTDPDVGASDLRGRRDPIRAQAPVLAAVSVGGMVGASARYGAGQLWPRPTDAFPWTTFGVNALGCLLIGVLITVIGELPAAHRLMRPFLGTGVLGGFTTFSTYAVDIRRLVALGQAPTAAAYLLGTAAAAMVMVWTGATATRRALAATGPTATRR
jgi:CrcB protein